MAEKVLFNVNGKTALIPRKEVKLELQLCADGAVELVTPGDGSRGKWWLLRINPDGSVSRHNHIPSYLGLATDDLGRLIIRDGIPDWAAPFVK